MQLPLELRRAIGREASLLPRAALVSAAAVLSSSYRQGLGRANISAAESVAYALVRMPATYAAVASVLPEISSSSSLLDLGTGPGTAGWAAAACWRSLRKITCIERESAQAALGQTLAAESPFDAVRDALWLRCDLTASHFEPHGAVVLSYSLGELSEPLRLRTLEAAWAAAQNALILIEPGTTPGFTLIRAMRTRLIEMGARIAAPCPHENACPIPAGDWCHFAARVERTALHRELKAGEMSYEDEKFSYLIASRGPVEPAQARIIRRPQKNPGLIQLSLCANEGLIERQVRKRDGEAWRAARKALWGGRAPER